MLALLQHSVVRPVISQTLRLEETATAHSLVESGHAFGRIVVTPTQ